MNWKLTIFEIAVGVVVATASAVGISSPPRSETSPTFTEVCESVKGKANSDPTRVTVDALVSDIVNQLGSLEDLGTEPTCSVYEEILTKFKKVTLSNRKISDLSPLATLPQLEQVTLSHNAIVDVSPLSSLHHLRVLTITGNQIKDLAPIGQLENLQFLDISANALSDASSLGTLTTLRRLNIANNQVTDLSVFAKLSLLEDLNMSNNGIRDIQPLASLLRLKILDISNNYVQNLDAVSKLIDLDRLNAQNNKISDIQSYQPNSAKQINLINNPFPENQALALKSRSKIAGSPILWIAFGQSNNPKRVP